MVWNESRTGKACRAATQWVEWASEGSTLLGAAQSVATRIKDTIHQSYCYRWLTAEPDPSVVVIDLQETRTVGPFVRLLGTAVDPVERAWDTSRLASVTTTVGAALSRSRTRQLLATLLEPPDPQKHRQ